MLLLYNAILLPLRVLCATWAAWPGGARRRREWAERRARLLPSVAPGGVWVHGASVGEARLAGTLTHELRTRRPGLPLSVSATTRTGRSQLPAPPRVDASFYFPLDFAGYPSRVLRAVRPAAIVLLETELWPNLLREARALGVPILVINGRIAPERLARYRRLSRLYGPLLAGIAAVGAQSGQDASRFVSLGLPQERVRVTGNVKYDLPAPPVSPARLRERFGLAPDRPVVVAGSTAAGEDGVVLEAFLEARRAHPALFLILAPRHPERAREVGDLAASRGVRLHRLSAGGDPSAASSDGLLLDAVGELASLYGIARAAFVGGSLVPVGGHNILEPAAVGVPVLFGPHTHHVAEPADSLVRVGGAVRVADGAELAREWARLVADPRAAQELAGRAAAVVEVNRGALGRSVAMILGVVDGACGPSARVERA